MFKQLIYVIKLDLEVIKNYFKEKKLHHLDEQIKKSYLIKYKENKKEVPKHLSASL